MKKKFTRPGYPCIAFILLTMFVLILSSPALARIEKGQTVPAFTLEKRGGGSYVYPKDATGKVIFLNFWAEWCKECKIELPELEKIKNKYQGKSFELLAINTDRKQKVVDRFLKKVKVDLMVLYDKKQELINKFQPVGIPASYIIKPDGKIESVHYGFKMDYIEKYIAEIDKLLAESDR